ncbi:MAG: hypothetical protein EOO46_20370, partial [Flavobacterium sp.]
MLENALEKAERLESDSFVTWNGTEAIIWKINERNYTISGLQRLKVYPKENDITVRNDLADRGNYNKHEAKLKKRLNEILHDLGQLYNSGQLTKAINISSNIVDAVLQTAQHFVPQLKNEIKELKGDDVIFKAEFNQWKIIENATLKILSTSSRRVEKVEPEEVLAKFTYYKLIGKILFYLTLSQNLSGKVARLELNSKDEVQNQLNNFFNQAKKIDYQAVFDSDFTEKIILNHDQSTFSLDFAALSFTAPERTRYAYRLTGLDDKWTYLEKNRKVYFTELPPGDYRFEVKASNSSDIWNGIPAMLQVHIKPPFWLSGYAYTLYFLIAGLIIWLTLRYYHRRVAELNARKLELLEHEKEREIYHSKIEFFTHVAHEIRTPLTLIKGPMEKVMRNHHSDPSILTNLRIMQRNTDRLLDLTTQLLDFRKTETNGFSLNFVRTDIAALLRDNLLRFKSAAEQKHLQFTLKTPESLLVYVDAEAVNKIISNLLNNAIKYADVKIDISLPEPSPNETTFQVIVANDGPLIPYE